jgi:hypothetical protein
MGIVIMAPSDAVVTRVDHLFINTDEVDGLVTLFTDTLALPVAWPIRDHGPFTSGGVQLGDMNLEIARGAAVGRNPAPRFGIAFAPVTLETSLAQLTARHILHGTPHAIRAPGPDGQVATLWTTVAIDGLLDDSADVFICAYSPLLRPPGKELRPMAPAGPLGVIRVAELRLGVPDVDAAALAWGSLLAPLEPAALGFWQPVTGPALRLVPASRVGLSAVVLAVRSLAVAAAFLREQGLFGESEQDSITMDHTRTNQAPFLLIEG